MRLDVFKYGNEGGLVMYFRFISGNVISLLAFMSVHLGLMYFISVIIWLCFRNVRHKIGTQLLAAYLVSILLIMTNLSEPYVLGYFVSLAIFTTIKIIEFKKSFEGETYRLITKGEMKNK